MGISVGIPNPLVSIASWATQKILFSKLILERSNQPIRKLAESHSEIDFRFKSVCANQTQWEVSLGKLTSRFIQQRHGCGQERD